MEDQTRAVYKTEEPKEFRRSRQAGFHDKMRKTHAPTPIDIQYEDRIPAFLEENGGPDLSANG